MKNLGEMEDPLLLAGDPELAQNECPMLLQMDGSPQPWTTGIHEVTKQAICAVILHRELHPLQILSAPQPGLGAPRLASPCRSST
jgi:hypothetical protein